MNATEADLANHYSEYNPTILRGTAFKIPPWIMVDPNQTIFKGPLWELFSYLSTSLNIQYEMKPYPDDTKFGHGKYDLKNQKWIGLLGLLHRNIVDFTMVPAGPNTQRCMVARMPLAFAYSDMTILSGQSLVDDPHGVMAFENISLQVWLFYLSCFVGASFISWLSEGSLSVRFNWGVAKNQRYNLLRFCWEFIGCTFSKEIRLPMRKTATRCILSLWLFGGLVITTIIGGDMTASMTIVPPHFTVDKLDDILQVPGLRPDVMQFSSHQSFIESNFPALAERINDLGSAIPGMKDLVSRAKFEDIVSQKAVQINDRYTLLSGIEVHCNFSKTTKTPIKGFYFAKNLISAIPVSMFFNKRLSRAFMDRVNVRMLRVLQSGVAEFWLQSVMDISPYCFSQPHSGEYAPLEVDHVLPAFKLWAKGLGAAAICFVYEFVRNSWKKKRLCLWRLRSLNRRTMDSFVGKQHRKKATTSSGSTETKSGRNERKAVSPSDFRRILWKDMSMETSVTSRVKESVVNRSSQASLDGREWSTGSVKRSKNNVKSREPIVRYVDTSTFFSSFN